MCGGLRHTELLCFLELTPVPTFIRYASFPLIEGGAVLLIVLLASQAVA